MLDLVFGFCIFMCLHLQCTIAVQHASSAAESSAIFLHFTIGCEVVLLRYSLHINV